MPRAALRALRPEEWVKNLFVLAPLLFAGRADDGGAVATSLLVVLAFCLVASAGYLLNDVRDAEADRAHSTKRHRPVASGALPAARALGLAAALAVLGLALAVAADPGAAGVLGAYAALTTAYTLGLKRLVVLDVLVIAACFLTRVLAGAVAIDADASRWLLVCTTAVALLLGFTKRRQEVLTEAAGGGSRPVLEQYSLAFLDQAVAVTTACTLLSYAIYATESPLAGDRMLLSAPAVVYGVLRWLHLVYTRQDARPIAAVVTTDPGMLGAGAAWVLSVAAVLYVL